MHHLLENRLVAVVAAAAIVVTGADLASYASDGHPFILGHANKEGSTSTLKTTGRGPALSLKSGRRSPSLAVSSSHLVKHLNAAKVDGLRAASLENNVRTYVVPGNTAAPFTLALAGLPGGVYTASFDVGMKTSGTAGICYLSDHEPTDFQVIAYGAVQSTFTVASASGLFTHRAGQTASLHCNNATATVSSTQLVSRVVLTRVDSLTTGSTALVPRSPGGESSLVR